MGDLAGVLLDAPIEARVLAHYRLVGDLLEQHFGGTPVVFANYPQGFDQPAHFHVCDDVPYTRNRVLWLCHRMFAVDFYTWAPLPNDPDRLRFARILLESPPDATRLAEGAQTMRALLAERGLQAIPMLDGGTGLALWIPFADAPRAEAVRPWLHALANAAVGRFPALFTVEPNTHALGRIHLHVSSNAPGHYSAVPYSVRGGSGLRVCTPVRWEELTQMPQAPTVDEFAQRFAQTGDLFGSWLNEIPPQRFANASWPAQPHIMESTEPRGSALTAAFQILEDGASRSAEDILHVALARGLVQPKMTKKYMYTALVEYIARTLGRGRKPLVVQNADRTFRINEPADDWPAFDLAQDAPPDADARALIDRLEKTAAGEDPQAFEAAVCDAFAHLGFAATHIGGHGAPDGYADAQLGVLGYRVMLECKSAKGVVTQPDCVEAAKYRAPYNADYCALVGPAFSDEQELSSELQTHGVTAIEVADLRTLIAMRATPLEIRALLKPGFAGDYLSDVLWERTHGKRKRIATVAHLVREAGWNAQVLAAKQGGPRNAPLLTVDAAMLLVDQALQAAGAQTACTREEVQAAFTHLTDPLVGAAVWADAQRSAIVITCEKRIEP